jgi:hypothetical protein
VSKSCKPWTGFAEDRVVFGLQPPLGKSRNTEANG